MWAHDSNGAVTLARAGTGSRAEAYEVPARDTNGPDPHEAGPVRLSTDELILGSQRALDHEWFRAIVICTGGPADSTGIRRGIVSTPSPRSRATSSTSPARCSTGSTSTWMCRGWNKRRCRPPRPARGRTPFAPSVFHQAATGRATVVAKASSPVALWIFRLWHQTYSAGGEALGRAGGDAAGDGGLASRYISPLLRWHQRDGVSGPNANGH